MGLEERLQRRLGEWRKLARRYRIAQDGCDVNTDEWWLNKENAEMIDRLSAELAGDLAVDLATTPTPRGVTRLPIDVAPVADAASF